MHISRLGASGGIIGLARFITCAAEVPLFRAAGWLIRKFGVFGVLALAQAAYVLRLLNYVALTPENVAWVLPSEVLHGFTFAVLWSACTYHTTIKYITRTYHREALIVRGTGYDVRSACTYYANAIAPDGLKAS